MSQIFRILFMSEDGFSSLAYSKNVIEFITVANEFCSFLDRADELDSATFLSRLQKILPLLYLKASLLPEFDFEPDEELEKYVTEVEYNLIQKKILEHTGAYDDYQEVFVPGMQFSESPLTASIAENVADIYQDTKDTVMSFRTLDESVIEQALWECRQNFVQIWGQKLVNCLRAIHSLVYNENFAENISDKSANNEKRSAPKPEWLINRFFGDEEE